MKFAQPLWLLLGFAACAALLWRYRVFDRRQRADLAKFASDSLLAQLTASVSHTRRHLKRILVITGVALIAVALARPLAGFRWEETRRKGLDLLIAVDTSKSMLARDVKPDRLTRSKMAVEDLLQKLEGDRVGLIAFAGNAFLQCPLTLDYDAFRQSLDALDTGIIPRGGTDIAAAIHEAEAALANNGANERILVLITDGEDLEGRALDAARDAAKNGLKIFTVGVGTEHGELIPVTGESGDTGFVKDTSGQFAKSKLDESMLRQIAEVAAGIYQPLGQQAQGLEALYRDGLSKFTRHDIASRQHKVYLERFQWPLVLGLLCLVLEPLIGIRKRRIRAVGVVSITARRTTARGLVLPGGLGSARRAGSSVVAAGAAALTLLALTPFAKASTGRAEKAYAKGEFDQAAREYQQAAGQAPQNPELQYNHGVAAYQAGQHEAAATAFAKAMKTDNVPLQQDNYYNLGNTQYRLGQKTEKANPQETLKTWEQAVQSYEAALQLKADDGDARYNRDLVKKKLEELKKQQEQQKQDQQQQQDQKDQKDPQQNKDNQQNPGSGQDKPDPKKPDDQKDNKDQQKHDGSSGDRDQKDQDKQAPSKGDQKDQPQSGTGRPDEQKPESAKDQKDRAGKDGKDGTKPEPRKDRANQKPELANKNAKPGVEKDDTQEEAESSRVPGKMSKQEAKQLLDSLKNGDRQMPLAPAARGQEPGRDDEPTKDW